MKVSEITQSAWDSIMSYMDDDIRESVYTELAPCTKEEFYKRGCELDSTFEEFVEREFDVTIC